MSSLIKIDKEPFDKYVKNIFENKLKDQFEFLKICPIFQKINKDELIKLGVRTEIKKFSTGQTILESNNKVLSCTSVPKRAWHLVGTQEILVPWKYHICSLSTWPVPEIFEESSLLLDYQCNPGIPTSCRVIYSIGLVQ